MVKINTILHSQKIFTASAFLCFDCRSPCPEARAIARACVHTRAKSPTSLSTVQLHLPNKNFVVATVILVTVTFCFYTSDLSCFILNETFELVQHQETLHFENTNLESQMQFQLILEQSLVQTRAHVRLDALAPINSGHGLLSTCLHVHEKHLTAFETYVIPDWLFIIFYCNLNILVPY